MLEQLAFNPLLAAAGATDIATDSITTSQQVAASWNDRWDEIFIGSNGLYFGIADLAMTLSGIAFLIFSFIWVRNALQSGVLPTIPQVVWPLLVVVLLHHNNGDFIGKFTKGMRDFTNARTATILEIQIGETSMAEAMTDVLVTADTRQRIQVVYGECEAKEGKAQLECFQKAGEFARAEVEKAEQAIRDQTTGQRVPDGLNRFKEKVEAIDQAINQDRGVLDKDFLSPLIGAMLQSAQQALAREILKGWQWAFANLIEIAMLVTGLLGPLAVAGALLPDHGRTIWTWISAFFGLWITKISYTLIVGLCAVVVAGAAVQDSGDFGFLILMAILAPLLALGLGAGGGMTIFHGVRGGVTRLVTAGISVLPVPR